MLAVESKHHIKLQMYGTGLDLVQATLRREYPGMKFSYDTKEDSDDDYIDSEDSEIMKEIAARMTPGDHLVIRRENKGWTQKELSEKTGIAIPNISLIEAGKRPIGARTAKKLAAALGCDVGDFIA
ncbi:MAG: helix-turn-helix transcriptional regulator [Treponemataceae bacterium]|nr:helix-turn-helix transcriptional regulator [Treponemataceae bacterium]